MNYKYLAYFLLPIMGSWSCQNSLNETTTISNCDEAIPSILEKETTIKARPKSQEEGDTFEYLEWHYDVLSEQLTLLHTDLCAPCGIGDAKGYALDYELISTNEGLELQEHLRDVSRAVTLKCVSCTYDMKLTATIPNTTTKFKVTKQTKDFDNGTQNFILWEGELNPGLGQGRLPLTRTFNACQNF